MSNFNMSVGYGTYGPGYGAYGPGYGTGYGQGLSGSDWKNDRAKRLSLTDEEKERRGIEDPAKEQRGKKLPGEAENPDEGKNTRGVKDSGEECQTCKNRKYKDGSDEMVSFKTPTRISPESAASAVRAHEQEHVSNAYAKAATKNGKVIAASVSIHTAICPECGRSYISGGTTHTQIKYYNEDNPYQKELKSADRAKYSGMNLDYAV